VDPSLSLMDKWLTPTKLSPAYYCKRIRRNGLSSVPGILTVVFLLNVIRRKPAVYSQYKVSQNVTVPFFLKKTLQYTVVLLTFGGYILMLPIMLFNLVVSGIVTYYDGRNTFEFISKQSVQIISLMRYLLILHGIEMNWPRITIASIIVMVPNVCYSAGPSLKTIL
ncbi:hypothetical protein PFISCL1PPCAC_27003, partial [Pristionchus fissidentatus]